MSDPSDDPTACPECGEQMRPDAVVATLLTCAHCGHQAFMTVDDEPPPDAPPPAPPHETELDSLRIRQLASAKRSTYRARSYCIMAASVCVVAILQLGWMTLQHVRALGWTMRPFGYLLFILLCAFAGYRFAVRAAELHRQAKQSALPEPSSPPDFSTLDDGSRRWKNLEEVR